MSLTTNDKAHAFLDVVHHDIAAIAPDRAVDPGRCLFVFGLAINSQREVCDSSAASFTLFRIAANVAELETEVDDVWRQLAFDTPLDPCHPFRSFLESFCLLCQSLMNF